MSSPGLTGRPSTPQPLDSIAIVSGILDHPPSRLTTTAVGEASCPCSTKKLTPSTSPETAPARRFTASSPPPPTSPPGRPQRRPPPHPCPAPRPRPPNPSDH